MKKNKEIPIITPIEDHPLVICCTLATAILLTLIAQLIWEDRVLNVMATFAPFLALIASKALRTREDDDGEEETLEEETNVRYAFAVMVAGYLGVFMARAMPPQYTLLAFMGFIATVAYVGFRLADRNRYKKEIAYERHLLDVPVQISPEEEDEFVEEGARESFYASLIEAQTGRRH